MAKTVKKLPVNEKVDALAKAQELIAAKEKELNDLAISVLNEAIKKVDEMGFKLEVYGEFKGNQIITKLAILKK